MRLFGAEREPQSQVTSLKIEEHSSGMLVQGDWERVQQAVLGYYRGQYHGTVELMTGRFTRPNAEMLASDPEEFEQEKLANLQVFDEKGNSNDTRDPRGYASAFLRRLEPNKYWLFFGFPGRDDYGTYHQRKALFDQSFAEAFDLAYGIRRQEMEVLWGLAPDEKYRIDRNKLLMAVQLATGAEFDRSSLRAFPDQPLLGESSTFKMELELSSAGRGDWIKKGANLEQAKQLAVDTGGVLYPRMSLVLHPSERVVDIVHDASRSKYDATTFDKAVIESMRASIRELSELLRVGSTL